MRILLSILFACLVMAANAAEVVYLESTGNNGGTRVFSVTTPVKEMQVETPEGKAKLKPEEQACRDLLNAILFEGVENYNDGMPLVADPNDAYARSLVNPKTRTFMTYCKEVNLENSPNNKQAFHYIILLNNYNLLRLLKMRGSIQ